jgi:transcriptional regulator with XRE-family HTH domain
MMMGAENFAGRLKELRERAGLTQQQLADRAGMNKFGVAQLEQGRNKPSWESVLTLADALGVTPNDFTQAPAAVADAKRGRPRKASTLADGDKSKKTTKKRKKIPGS